MRRIVSARSQHLFTCELNTAELRTIGDCVERLKVLEETGRLWGQNMLLQVSGPMLLLTDIETKVPKGRGRGGLKCFSSMELSNEAQGCVEVHVPHICCSSHLFLSFLY